MDKPEAIACPTANGTSHLTFDRWVISCGFKSLFDMRFWMYYSERTDTQFNLPPQVLDLLLLLLLFFFMAELTLNEIVEYGISKSRKFRNSSGSSNK